jgi:hypothetical protein
MNSISAAAIGLPSRSRTHSTIASERLGADGARSALRDRYRNRGARSGSGGANWGAWGRAIVRRGSAFRLCEKAASSSVGVGRLTDRRLVRLYWRLLDTLDYWVTQARLWLADVVCGPEPETGADQWRERDPRELI